MEDNSKSRKEKPSEKLTLRVIIVKGFNRIGRGEKMLKTTIQVVRF